MARTVEKRFHSFFISTQFAHTTCERPSLTRFGRIQLFFFSIKWNWCLKERVLCQLMQWRKTWLMLWNHWSTPGLWPVKTILRQCVSVGGKYIGGQPLELSFFFFLSFLPSSLLFLFLLLMWTHQARREWTLQSKRYHIPCRELGLVMQINKDDI